MYNKPRSWIEGEEYDIYTSCHGLTINAINENGYAVDWKNFFQCEVYTDSRFDIPKSKGEKIKEYRFYKFL